MTTNSRFASIEGTLNKRPKIRPALIVDEPEQQPDKVLPPESLAVGRPKTTAPRKSNAPASSNVSDGGTRRIAFRLDAELHERLTKRVAFEGTTQAYVVLDAIEGAFAAGILADEPKGEPVQTGSLFARPKGRKPAVPAVPTEIRVDARAQDQIDTMVETYEFESRTQLIAMALRHYLI